MASTPQKPNIRAKPPAKTSGREPKNKTRNSWLKGLFIFILIIGCITGGVVLGWAHETLRDLPELKRELLLNPPEASTIYDRNGIELVKLSTDQNFRLLVPFTDFPQHLKDALVASEDHTFYEHPGIDLNGIARMVFFGGSQGGGSTITQQVVRNVFLTLDPTLERKLREIVLAIRLEQQYTKDEILYFYLNQVFFGHWAKGVQAASKLYFGKDVKDLTLSESAMIIAMLPSPNEYSPYINYDLAKKMRGIVLDLMVEHNKITAAEAQAAKEEELQLASLDEVKQEHFASSYYTDCVINEAPYRLADAYGGNTSLALDALYNGGLKITISLDSVLQAEVEENIADVIQAQIDAGNTRWAQLLEDGSYDRQVAAVITAVETGEVVAMVGGREYPQDASFAWNRAFDSLRQPGSSIKPLIDYAPALQKGIITPGTVFDDVPTAWGSWMPTNFDSLYCGLITIREGLARSQNITAIKTLQALGVHNGINFLKQAGISTLTEDDNYLPVAIGGLSQGVSVLEMTMAYAMLMNNGVYVEPVLIKEISDRNGKVLYTAEPKKTVVLDVQTNYLVLDLLKSSVTLPYGTSRLGNLQRPTAAKTGTTDDFNDLWFCGGTPDYASAIWIGHDLSTPMNDLYGTGIAPRIWSAYMLAAHRDLPSRDWERPDGLVNCSICTVSGKRPSPGLCPSSKITQEIFKRGTEPAVNDTCTTHVSIRVDKTNGLLATPQTPASQVEERVFIRRPVPLPSPLPYGRAPLDAGDEAPTQFSTNAGQSSSGGTPSTPGGQSTTPSTPGGQSTTPSSPGSTTTTPPGVTGSITPPTTTLPGNITPTQSTPTPQVPPETPGDPGADGITGNSTGTDSTPNQPESSGDTTPEEPNVPSGSDEIITANPEMPEVEPQEITEVIEAITEENPSGGG